MDEDKSTNSSDEIIETLDDEESIEDEIPFNSAPNLNQTPTPMVPVTNHPLQMLNEDSDDTSEEAGDGEVFQRDSVVQHPSSCTNHFNFDEIQTTEEPETSHSRARMQGTSYPGRPVDERIPPIFPGRTRDIPGRILTEGDLIRYFSGYLENEGEVWLTARVEKMTMTQQRKYPEHYNILNESGESISLHHIQGKKFEVRRNDRWEKFYE